MSVANTKPPLHSELECKRISSQEVQTNCICVAKQMLVCFVVVVVVLQFNELVEVVTVNDPQRIRILALLHRDIQNNR